MRAMLKQADLAGYAGQFVWLELNFDKAENHAFLVRYGAISTPTFYLIEPHDGRVGASQSGAMSLEELKKFLERGASAAGKKTRAPWEEALINGDSLLAQKPDKAIEEYREALKAAPPKWSRRALAQSSLVTALQNSGEYRQCAETAASEAAGMERDAMFARTVVSGMWCLVTPDPAPWTDAAARKLVPLAKEALSLTTTVRDHRDELYRTLMYFSLSRNDKAGAANWGDHWLQELEAIKPINDEQRSAVDIARVEEVQAFGDPKRVLPELIASERAMPNNWNASLRVAQMESAAKNYDAAIAACDRGVARGAGPAGRAWILRVKADALIATDQRRAARFALKEALAAAEKIPNPQTRENNVKTIKAALERAKDEKK